MVRSTSTNSSCGTGNTLRNQPTAPRNKTRKPMTLTAELVTRPAKINARPKAVTKGHGVGAGTSMMSPDVFARSVSDRISSSTHANGSTPNDIHDGKNDDPHCVDEVPIPGDHLDALLVQLRQITCQAENEDKQ